MANALGPYWIQINYHSVYAPHTMTIPTKAWNPGVGAGTFETWGGTPISAITMIENLVTVFLPFYHSTIGFDNWTIFKQLLPADDPVPVKSGAFSGMAGTDASPGWYAAVEQIFLARTASFGIAKLTLLDSASNNDFNPRQTWAGADDDVFQEWSSDLNGWCGRDNAQIATPLKITLNINDKLRKAYRLD